MKLSQWAKKNGLTYQTAWKMFRANTLPVKATQLATGTILVDMQEPVSDKVFLYARVCGSDQKSDLERQVGRLASFAAHKGWMVSGVVSEVGSGLNGSRPKLQALLKDPSIGVIVVEHRERLARFGVEYIESALSATGRRLVIIEDKEIQDDLVSDMVDVMTSFCARLYGKRSANRRAKAAMDCINKVSEQT